MDITAVASVQQLREWVKDARQRTFELVGDLTDEQLMGPQLSVVNPGLWEMGHHAWFQSVWTLRHAGGQPPVLEDEDALYDSMAVAHDNRWDLPLPNREETLAYMREVQRLVLALLDDEPSDELLYHALYSTLHEDMHTEAITYTRQTHGYPEPRLTIAPADDLDTADGGTLTGDAEVPGGTFMLGSTADEPFVFDNEKWAHRVELQPFRIARVAVTQGDYATFIDDGGYAKQQLWSDAGWKWRCEAGADSHLYFSKDSSGAWQRRHFDQWVELEPHRAVIHVNQFEAEAYCNWANRRLPTEAEWEAAAVADVSGGTLGERVGTFPWGDAKPGRDKANLDWQSMGTIDVGALPAGDSPCGCRQMIGNVWEWTDTDFKPFPGFVPDPYAAYSEPWFHTRKVMRGGGWTTRSRLIRTNYRNFQTPDRRDVLTGFRTCAL